MATVAPTPRSKTITLASTTAGPFDVGFRLFGPEVIVSINDISTDAYTLNAVFADGYCDTAQFTLGAEYPSGTVIRIASSLPHARSDDYLPSDPGLTRKLNIELARAWSKMGDLEREIVDIGEVPAIQILDTFSSRDDFIVWAGSASVAEGAVARVRLNSAPYVIEFRYVDALTAVIADIPGWAPVAPVYAQHYGIFPSDLRNGTTTDYTAHVIDAVNNTDGELIFTGWVKITDKVICPNTCRLNVPAGRAYGGFSIRTDFNLAAGCVLQFGTGETGPTMGDFGMWFEQPASPANRAALIAYPPAIDISTTPRGTINSLRIEQGIDGIKGIGNCGGFKFGTLELGCFGTDIAIDGALDFVQCDSIHIYPFGFASNTFKTAIFYDGVGYAANLGRVDNWTCDKFSSYRKKIALADTGGTARLPYVFNAIGLDGDGARLLLGAGDSLISNLYSVKTGLPTVADIVVTAGRHAITNASISGGGTVSVDVQGGELSIDGRIHNTNNAVSPIIVSSGKLTLDSTVLEWTDAVRTAPFVLQSGTGILRAAGLSAPVATVGEAIRFTTDLVENYYDGSLVNQLITLAASRSVGWYGDTQYGYSTRAVAALARVPYAVRQIVVLNGLDKLEYVDDAAGTALTTADGRTWSPKADNITPDHFVRNVTPGTTQMAAGIQAANNFAAALPGGGEVVFGPVAYLVNTPIIRAPNVSFRGRGTTAFVEPTNLVGISAALRKAAYFAMLGTKIIADRTVVWGTRRAVIETHNTSANLVLDAGMKNFTVDANEIAPHAIAITGVCGGKYDDIVVGWGTLADWVCGPGVNGEKVPFTQCHFTRCHPISTNRTFGAVGWLGGILFWGDARKLVPDGIEVFTNANQCTMTACFGRVPTGEAFVFEDSDDIKTYGCTGPIGYRSSDTITYGTKSVSLTGNYGPRHHVHVGHQGSVNLDAATTPGGRAAFSCYMLLSAGNGVSVSWPSVKKTVPAQALGANVINGATTTVPYPAGTVQSDYVASGISLEGSVFIDAVEYVVELAGTADVEITFGAANITITNNTGVTWNAGQMISVDRIYTLWDLPTVMIDWTGLSGGVSIQQGGGRYGGYTTGVKLNRNSSQSIPHATNTMAEWTTVQWERGLEFADLVAHPTRITVPRGVRQMRFSANVLFAGNAVGIREAHIVSNVYGQVGMAKTSTPGDTSGTNLNCSTAWLDVKEGDYVELRLYQTSGVALNVTSNPSHWLQGEAR